MSLIRAKSPLKSLYPCFISGKPITTSSTLPVIDKYTNEVACVTSLASPEHIEQAISAASDARKAMKNLPIYERKEILLQVADEIKAREEEIAYSLCVEGGKDVNNARVEVGRAIDVFTASAEEAVRCIGEYSNMAISKRNAGFESITKRVPIGPISMVSPFNFPVNLVAHKVAPAIAAGCPFILKPSDRSPLGALIIADILSKTSLPEGAFSVIPCLTEHASPLTEDERFKLLSFTGSGRVGWALKSQAGRKNVILELGGNAACVVDEGSDVDEVVKRVGFGAFYYQGQSCISVQRVILHDSLYEEVKAKLVSYTADINEKQGDPMDSSTFLGPMISPEDALRVDTWVQEAIEEGATLVAGGNRNGSFFDATILEGVKNSSKVRCEEVFGPVCILDKYSNFKQAIDMVNDSEFGLQTGVFTNDMNKSFYAFDNLEVGGVVINDIPSVRVDTQPYGGVKGSGIGREGVKSSIEHLTEIRIMTMKNFGKL